MSGPYTLKIPPVDEIMAESPSELRIEIEKLEQKHAENPEGRYFVPLANAYRKLGAVEHAESLLLDGLRKHPEYLSAHIVLGRCLAARKANAKAIEEFHYVLSIDPQNLVALRSLGEIALDQDQPGDAAHWFQELISVDPMNEDARRALEQLGTSSQPEGRTATEPAGGWLEAMDEEMNGLRRTTADEPTFDMEEPVRVEPVPAERDDLAIEHFASFDASEPYAGHSALSEADLLRDDEEDAPGELVTETIAELYARQGFYDRSADVLRELIRRRGGDENLSRRLEEIERLAANGQTGLAQDDQFSEHPFAAEASDVVSREGDFSAPDFAAYLPEEGDHDAVPSPESARDANIEGFEGFDRAEKPAQEMTFEPARFGEQDAEGAPDPAFEPEPFFEHEAEPEEEPDLTPVFSRFEEEQPTFEAAASHRLEHERSAESSPDSDDAFAASFTHGFHSQPVEDGDSPDSDAGDSGDRDRHWEDGEGGSAPDDVALAESISDGARAGGESGAQGEPETIAGYLGGLASWRPRAAAEHPSRGAVAPAGDSDDTGDARAGYLDAAQGEPSEEEARPYPAASFEAAPAAPGQDDASPRDPIESFGAPAPEALVEAEQIDGRDDFDLEFPSAEPPQNEAAGNEGTGSAAAEQFPWEVEGETEPPRPASEQHAGDQDGEHSAGRAVEPGSFEEYLSFDGATSAGSVANETPEHGTTPATPRTPEAPASPSGEKVDDDDLESFQTWLRSLKR
ncbi:hypothetical protein BH23GEM8_BH23GEM8_00530 [soil metagenome]